MAKRKMAAECEDFEEFYWPARCRGYLEGRQASDCLASVELARLRAELETSEARADAFLQEGEGFQNEIARLRRGPCDICRNWYREVDRLRAENERLRAALGRYQWVGRLGHPRLWCPSCRNWKSQGHTTDCQLAAALKDVPCP